MPSKPVNIADLPSGKTKKQKTNKSKFCARRLCIQHISGWKRRLLPYKDLNVSCHGGETRLIYSDFLSSHHFVLKGWHFTWLTNTVSMFAVLL